MEPMNVVESMFRWSHVVAGITWVGLLYFFNFINSQVVPTMDAETKKKVLPELLPRVLYWFRMGGAWTWVTGVFLLVFVFYAYKGVNLFGDGTPWTTPAIVMLLVTFFGVFLYDILYKTVLKSPTIGFWGGWVLASAVVFLFSNWANFTQRGAQIHLGAMFGTFMAYNVWFRIWPAQQKIVRAIKDGEKPDPELAALAGLRSKHNTYMSLPLVFAMINAHTPWIGSQPMFMSGIILGGWAITWMLYKKAGKVQGF